MSDRIFNDKSNMIKPIIISYDDKEPDFKYQILVDELYFLINTLYFHLIDFVIPLISPLVIESDASEKFVFDLT